MPPRLLLASLPSPSFTSVSVGPLELRAYGVLIALAVIAAVWLAERRWVGRGHPAGVIQELAMWAVPAGLIGARIYHVVTTPERFQESPLRALAIWQGGLGIPGALLAGVVTGLVVARRRGVDLAELLDAVAPALPLAQAIGRWGNWFNQELFGSPTNLPWGLRIDPRHRPAAFADVSTFHPAFLYESLWNLAIVGALLVAERRLRLAAGRLFALYLGGYAAGRLWIEGLRIDPANSLWGLRVNEWAAIGVLLGVAGFLVVTAHRNRSSAKPSLAPVESHMYWSTPEPGPGLS